MNEKSFASDISFLLPYSVLNNLNLGDTFHFIYISQNLETVQPQQNEHKGMKSNHTLHTQECG